MAKCRSYIILDYGTELEEIHKGCQDLTKNKFFYFLPVLSSPSDYSISIFYSGGTGVGNKKSPQKGSQI